VRSQLSAGVELEELPTARMFELVSLGAAHDLPAALSGISTDGAGNGLRMAADQAPRSVLRLASDRWLLRDPGSELLGQLGAQSLGVTEVTGKWRPFRLSGPRAARLLASALDVGVVLADRDCARVVVFDCPGVLVRESDGYTLMVERSYASAFLSAAAGVASRLDE
jgi:sarcosine oxidase gamma subunit